MADTERSDWARGPDVKLTLYQIGNRIKALLDENANTNVILETVGIKRAQLTTYK